MSHQIDTSNKRANMAYVGDKPWHGLGQELTENASLEVWKKESGMNWEIKDSPIMFSTGEGSSIYKGERVLFRGDTNQELSIVSDSYKVVQPEEVLDFFQDLVTLQGMKLATAGVLYGGRRFWALADTGRAAEVLGKDHVKGMLLLTTSCDGTLATNAMFTTVRVVCSNTLSLALQGDKTGRSRVTHRSVFDPSKMKSELGLFDTAWDEFKKNITSMSKTKIDDMKARNFIRDLIKNPEKDDDKQSYTVDKDVIAIMDRYKNGMGSDMSYGTVWGLLNGITENVDHGGRQRIPDHQLWSSWYGKGANLKTEAYVKALELV